MSEAGEWGREVPDARTPTTDLKPAMDRLVVSTTGKTCPARPAEKLELSLQDLREGTGAEAADARRLRENLERRAGDQQLREALARADFTGPAYLAFEDELARYGISVMRGWLYTGRIFELTGARGLGLHPSEGDLERMYRDGDEREELALVTVASALPRFKKRALIEGGWTHEGGASIATYFMGSCLPVFANEFRRWQGAERRWRNAHFVQAGNLPPEASTTSNPAAQVSGMTWVRAVLTQASPREQQILALTLDGWSQEEIVELLDETSVRAVEGVLFRWRTKLQKYPREGGEHRGQ